MGLETHVVEFAPRLMPRQTDDAGGAMLAQRIRELGVVVHVARATREITGGYAVDGLVFEPPSGNRTEALPSGIDADLVVISAGIRPNDELATWT